MAELAQSLFYICQEFEWDVFDIKRVDKDEDEMRLEMKLLPEVSGTYVEALNLRVIVSYAFPRH